MMHAPDEDDAITRMLKIRKSKNNPGGIPWEDVASKLASLPPDKRFRMAARAEWTIKNLPAVDESEALILLLALAITESKSLTRLALMALESPNAYFKEDYAVLLDFMGENELADRALASVLNNSISNFDRPDLSATLRTLHARGAREYAATARPFVNNQDPEVRGAAMNYIYDYDTGEAGVVFLARLQNESDPEIAQFLIDGLVMWHHVDAIPQLSSMQRNKAVPSELRAAALAAIADLQSGEL